MASVDEMKMNLETPASTLAVASLLVSYQSNKRMNGNDERTKEGE